MAKKKLSKKRLWIGIGVLLVVVVAGAVGYNMSGDKSEGVEVETAEVGRHKVVQTVTATGRIQPVTQVNISADVSAKIIRLSVNEGEWVEKGTFLLELDNERYLASVEQSEANLRSIQSDARLAKENMIKVGKDYERSKELFDQNLESQSALDATYAAYEVEKARYASGLDRVEQARASLKEAADALSKTKIFAPMSGTISRLNKELGEMALGSQFQEDVIMEISNLTGMEALVDVDENDIITLSVGDTAKIEVDALPDVVFTGVVSEIANSAKISGQGSQDQKTEFEVKVAVSGAVSEGDAAGNGSDGGIMEVKPADHKPTRSLRPGMTASSDIVTETRKNAIAVPIQSVAVRTATQLEQEHNNGNDEDSSNEEKLYTPDKDGFVEIIFVVKDGKVEARQVKTGIQSDTHIEILSGLEPGEEIVIGNYRAISKDLHHGAKIVIKKKMEARQEQLARG